MPCPSRSLPAKPVLGRLAPGGLRALAVEHAMQENVRGCEPRCLYGPERCLLPCAGCAAEPALIRAGRPKHEDVPSGERSDPLIHLNHTLEHDRENGSF